MKKYKLKISYDPVDGQWSLKLFQRWFMFWLPRYYIYTTEPYTRNSTYRRWVDELDMEVVYVNSKSDNCEA